MLSPKGDDILRIPVTHGLVLDPWLEPLPSPGPAPYSNPTPSSGHPKLLAINAEGFTLWTEHFKRLEEVVPAWPESALLTISTCPPPSMWFNDSEISYFVPVGAQHNSFSDLPVLPPIPIRKSAARPIMNVIKALTLAFLDDQLHNSLHHLNIRKLDIEYPKSRPWDKKPKRRLVGNAGDVIIHRFGVSDDDLSDVGLA